MKNTWDDKVKDENNTPLSTIDKMKSCVQNNQQETLNVQWIEGNKNKQDNDTSLKELLLLLLLNIIFW